MTSTIDRDEVERVAAGLTPGERKIVRETELGQVRDYSDVHGIPRVSLFRKHLVERNYYRDAARFQLSDRGLAVRQYLLEQEQQS